MSKKCGQLLVKSAEVGGKPVSWLAGYIDLTEFSANVRLVSHVGRGANAPAFKIEVKTAKGWREIAGGAWVKDSENVRGGRFFTLTVDDDGMSKPVYVTAFPDDDQPGDADPATGEVVGEAPVTRYSVVWSRARKSDTPSAAKAAPLRASPVDAGLDDDIPFK